MRINERISLVGSGRNGFQLTHRMDCNIYLLEGGTECALIDAGGGVEPERIIEQIKRLGISMDKVTYLLLTHVHGDHAAGAHYFHEQYGMKVIVSAEAASWLETGDMGKNSLQAAIDAGVYPPDYVYHGCPVYRGIMEGDNITIGDLNLSVINTPGHSRGHVSYLLEQDGINVLFAGDVIFAGGRIAVQNIWDCSIPEYADSIAKLSRLQIDQLFAGHGAFLLNQAYLHINHAHECFKRLELPRGL